MHDVPGLEPACSLGAVLWLVLFYGWCYSVQYNSVVEFVRKYEIWAVAFLPSCTVGGFRHFSIVDECEVA